MTTKDIKKVEIKIDITDWDQEYQEKDIDVSSEDQIINRSKEGIKPSEMGRMVISARERGDTPKNVIRPNKMVLMAGAAYDISKMIASKFKEAETRSGKLINIRSYVGATEDAEKDVYVDSDTKAGYDNAVSYILNIIPGHLQSRLAIIAANGGDIKDVWEQFKVLGDEVVSKLLERPS